MTKQSKTFCSRGSNTRRIKIARLKPLHSRKIKENEYSFVLQPKADHHGSKIRFRDYRGVGPFILQRVLPNENYIVRRLNTNKTQILHRILLIKFVPNPPLEDNFRENRLQPDEEIFIPQDDFCTITWETNFGEQLVTRGCEPTPTNLPTGEQPTTANANASDAHENKTDYIFTRDELNDATDAARNQKERLNDDVSKRKEANEAARDETSDWPIPAVYPKKRKNFAELVRKTGKRYKFSRKKVY